MERHHRGNQRDIIPRPAEATLPSVLSFIGCFTRRAAEIFVIALCKECFHAVPPVKWKAMSYIHIDTGCRRGELMGLQWNCVDLDKGIMMIQQALLYTKDKGTYVGPPKTAQPRAICLSPETIGVL